jgi:hypothetical protein
MNAPSFFRVRIFGISALLLICLHPCAIQAQPMIISSIPANGATGVSTTNPVVFTFNTNMNTTVTTALFIYGGSSFASTLTTWNANATIMTNTPSPAFPANTAFTWFVSGQSAAGVTLGGVPTGTFTTGSGGGGGGGGGGSGTNPITTFSVIKGYLYDQTNTSAPVLDPATPYTFVASTVLASNRSATAVTVTLPNGTSVSNLMQNPIAHEDYFLGEFYTDFTTFSNSWPDGTYTFKVVSNALTQTVPVTLPASMVQPNAPHVSNYTAAQTVNPTQPFTLTWDMFVGGTTTDFVYVAISTNFTTANPENNGALNGTVTSVLIPANTLPTNSALDGTLSFYRVVYATNATGYATLAAKVSSTQFILTTGGGGTIGPLKLLSPAFVSGVFNFSVTSGLSQTFTVEYTTNLTGSWQSLVTTSSSSGNVRLADPHSTSNRNSFYRARNGP